MVVWCSFAFQVSFRGPMLFFGSCWYSSVGFAVFARVDVAGTSDLSLLLLGFPSLSWGMAERKSGFFESCLCFVGKPENHHFLSKNHGFPRFLLFFFYTFFILL